MTPDKLLKLTEKEWDELDDATLYKTLEPYFKVTRPDPANRVAIGGAAIPDKTIKTTKRDKRQGQKDAAKEIGDLIARLGITLPPKTPQ